MKVHVKKTEIVLNDFEERDILYAFHDIDGTHSLIREWMPVMSICLYDVIRNGLPEKFDSGENQKRLIELAGLEEHVETDKFCIESAGLSALTQMEWAIRRAVEEGTIEILCDKKVNSEIIQRIWKGEEYFDDCKETEEMLNLISTMTPRLFKLYEKVLNGYCRDKNLMLAKQNPKKFQVPGSMEFMKYLKEHGVKNYFVTGAVVEKGMGMCEEVETLGYRIGPGEIVEGIIGSTWSKKMPKDMIMKKLCKELQVEGKNVLVVGDGRSEISAGKEMGALTISRLPKEAAYQRKLHKLLGTNMIVEDYRSSELFAMFE